MTKRSQIFIGVAVAIVLFVVGGFVIERRIGSGINVADLGVLLDSQPVMPGMELPVLGEMPDLEGLVAWINSPELTKADLEGKVILVDFWTYSCINCIRTYPYLRAWWEKYQGDDFILLGIHTPEFAFEEKLENVKKAAEENNLTFPIALDNDYKTWRNFNNRFWPAKYLFDKEGSLRYTHFGEGKYDETEAAIQQLLDVEVELSEEDPGVDFSKVGSPETYLGYGRSERLIANPARAQDIVQFFEGVDDPTPLNYWVLHNTWYSDREYIESRPGEIRVDADGNSINERYLNNANLIYHFQSSVVNIVGETEGEPIQATILLDGKPIPEMYRGDDIQTDSEGNTTVLFDDAGLYELIQGYEGRTGRIQIIVPESGLRLFAFTFG